MRPPRAISFRTSTTPGFPKKFSITSLVVAFARTVLGRYNYSQE
jgi:hypothetical protein